MKHLIPFLVLCYLAGVTVVAWAVLSTQDSGKKSYAPDPKPTKKPKGSKKK